VARLLVRTVVYGRPERVYEFLTDFPGYARYSKYLTSVRQSGGDGGPGTRYALTFEWWRLSYTARSEVTGVDPPRRIDWRLTKDIDASGYWAIDPLSAVDDPDPALFGREADEAGGTDAPGEASGTNETDEADGTAGPPGLDDAADGGEACRVTFAVAFDPESADAGILDLPRFVSFDRVLERALPLIRREAARVVERAVADIEGERRDVTLHVETEGDDRL
jgi:hypothetical protein